MKTIIFGGNEIKISEKPLLGQGSITYNNIEVPVQNTFGSSNNVFVAFEEEGYVQYDVTIRLRWHGLGYYTTVKRQQQLIYSDRKGISPVALSVQSTKSLLRNASSLLSAARWRSFFTLADQNSTFRN